MSSCGSDVGAATLDVKAARALLQCNTILIYEKPFSILLGEELN
jgi:hypothetical protein